MITRVKKEKFIRVFILIAAYTIRKYIVEIRTAPRLVPGVGGNFFSTLFLYKDASAASPVLAVSAIDQNTGIMSKIFRVSVVEMGI